MKTAKIFSKCLAVFLLLVDVFLLTASGAFADVEIKAANFPDGTFRSFVSENFDTDSNGTLSNAELAAVTEINVSSKNISRLNGIEYFTKLEVLSCDHNNITNIDLHKNTALVSLNCNWNYLTRLDVSNSPNLSTLSCSRNDITVLNVSNTALTSIELNAAFLNYTKNSANRSPIKGIYAKNCTQLEKFIIDVTDDYYIDTIDLSGCTVLNRFSVNDYNRYYDSIYYNSIYGNYIKNINFRGCTALEKLSGNSDRCSLINLQLESLDISGCTALVSLDVSRNNLTVLDVSDCTALKNLDCSLNKLTMLDLSNNTALTSVTCANQKADSQKITTSSDGTCKFDFSTLIPAEYISRIYSDSVHGYTIEGLMIDVQYSDGVTIFDSVPAEIEYDFETGFNDVAINVTFAVTASEGTATETPVITTTSLSYGIVNLSYTATLNASGTTPITWSVKSGNLPDGLTLNSSTGVISGIPTVAGTSKFTVQAENTDGTVTKEFTIVVGDIYDEDSGYNDDDDAEKDDYSITSDAVSDDIPPQSNLGCSTGYAGVMLLACAALLLKKK